MNFEMSKKLEKGNEKVVLTISPSDNLEREFFNALFSIKDLSIEAVPNGEQILICKKEAAAEKKEL
jgi:hypothetical protein